MLKLNSTLSVATYGNNSKVVNPRNPNKIYQCDSLCGMQDKNGGNTLHVILREITDDEYSEEKTVVELNQFMNTWNPYVELEKEEDHEITE